MDYNDKILGLFSGDLKSQERRELNLACASDSELQEDLKLQQELLFTIRDGEDDIVDFRSQLKGIGADFLEEEERPRRLLPAYWAAAASIIIIIGLVSYLGLFSNDYYTGDYAFSKYYEPFGASMTVRGEGRSSQLETAIAYYQEGKLSESLQIFEKLKSDNIELASFFSGLCYLELGMIDKAADELISVKKEAVFYAEHIEWYLALCYLKQEQLLKAKTLLSEVAESNNQYSENAKAILDKMKS